MAFYVVFLVLRCFFGVIYLISEKYFLSLQAKESEDLKI